MAKHIPATYVYAPAFSVSVQEYEEDRIGGPLLLVRATCKATVSLGFDLSPENALKLAEALTKHANNLLTKTEAEAL
jgi:hypothetical protein